MFGVTGVTGRIFFRSMMYIEVIASSTGGIYGTFANQSRSRKSPNSSLITGRSNIDEDIYNRELHLAGHGGHGHLPDVVTEEVTDFTNQAWQINYRFGSSIIIIVIILSNSFIIEHGLTKGENYLTLRQN